MTNWYEVTAKYEKDHASGVKKKVSEKYLAKAVCVADAEKTVVEMLCAYYGDDIEVKSAVQRDYTEIFRRVDCDKWYKGKLVMVTVDEKTGAEKKSFFYVMVEGRDLEDAVKGIREGMAGSLIDWSFNAVQETAVLEVYGE